jgi:hypothetical protein
MKFSLKLKKELYDLMEELQDVYLLQKKGTMWFTFNTFPDDEVIDFDYFKGLPIANRRIELLEKLVEMEVLDIKRFPQETKLPENRFSIKLKQDKFSKLFNDLKVEEASSNLQKGVVAVYLDSDGNFWMTPKEKLCYALKGNRLKILTYLVDNQGYQQTRDIADYLGNEKLQNVRSEIGKMKKNIKKFLQLDDVIESGVGYRINPEYKIIRI